MSLFGITSWTAYSLKVFAVFGNNGYTRGELLTMMAPLSGCLSGGERVTYFPADFWSEYFFFFFSLSLGAAGKVILMLKELKEITLS